MCGLAILGLISACADVEPATPKIDPSSVTAEATPVEAIPGESVAGEAVAVESIAVPFDSSDPEARGSKSLQYRAGFWLKSDGDHFGGFSGLLIENDVLTAASDHGWWWQARLVLSSDGTLVGLADHRQVPIFDTDGTPVSRLEGRHDAEELLPGKAGLVLSFERDHRIHLYRSAAGRSAGQQPIRSTAINDQAPQALDAPAGLELASENSGLEAMAPLTGDRTLLLLEAALEPGGDIPGWVSEPAGGWSSLCLVQTEDFAPTAADALANGDIILVERSYTPERGTRVRISWLPDSEIQAGARLRPRELLRLAPPQAVDNFEALSIHQGQSGEHSLYLLSDDNFSAKQRTLLLQFELDLDSLPNAVSGRRLRE